MNTQIHKIPEDKNCVAKEKVRMYGKDSGEYNWSFCIESRRKNVPGLTLFRRSAEVREGANNRIQGLFATRNIPASRFTMRNIGKVLVPCSHASCKFLVPTRSDVTLGNLNF